MTKRKERLTVTVDEAFVRAANEAVAAGRADSISGWVNVAMAERVSKERRLSALGKAIGAYEKLHGVITAEELVEQERADRRAAIVVKRRRSSARRRGAA
jgi:hypothetical protein